MDFNEILAVSYKSEEERLDREYAQILEEEYHMDPDLRSKLLSGTYPFPDVTEVKTDKQIMTRIQDWFSAKVHIPRTPRYFHKHDFVELLYQYKGSCKQYIENSAGCILLEEGDLFLLGQNVIHALWQEDPEAILIKIILPEAWIHHEFVQKLDSASSLYDFFLGAKAEKKGVYHYLHFHGCMEERWLIERLMMEFYQQQYGYEEAVSSYLLLLMMSLIRNERPCDEQKERLAYSSLQTAEIVQYVYDHSETVTLESLSRHFSFSPGYLSRMIKANCKMGFREMLKNIRIEKALVLLCNSEESVERIAQQVGYQNAVPIYKEIREKFGVSPAEYRRTYSKKK